MFNMLYVMFMDQYIELWNVLDLIVECICVFGFLVFGIYSEFVKFMVIMESVGVLKVMEMIQ